MKILFACSEYHPLIQTDDIADFAASLTRAIGQLADDIRVILPAYPEAVNAAVPVETVARFDFSGCDESIRLLKGRIDGISFPVYLVEATAMFTRHGHPYLDAEGNRRPDNLMRYAMFSQAVTMIALNHVGLNWKPDLVHCNDWQTGLVPAMLAQDWNRPATLFTFHHLSAKDDFDRALVEGLKLPGAIKNSTHCQVDGRYSLTRAGIAYSDCAVSGSHYLSDHLQDSPLSPDLKTALGDLGERLKTVMPALDETRWNPANDKLISQPYDAATIDLKAPNKLALQQKFALEASSSCLVTVFAELTRDDMDEENISIDFLTFLLEKTTIQLLICCQTPKGLAAEKQLEEHFPGRVSLVNLPNEKLLHRLIAGSDAAIFGNEKKLTRQLPRVCCRYGTVPMLGQSLGHAEDIINATSENLMKDKATGYVYANNHLETLLETAERLVGYHGRSGPWWKKLATNCMKQFVATPQNRLEFAHQYLECYQYAIDNPASNPDQS